MLINPGTVLLGGLVSLVLFPALFPATSVSQLSALSEKAPVRPTSYYFQLNSVQGRRCIVDKQHLEDANENHDNNLQKHHAESAYATTPNEPHA
jgi:hypothetical protein